MDHLPCVLFLLRPLALLGRFSSLQHDFSLARSFLADPFLFEILLRLGVVSWPHLLALCVEDCCCMYDVKSVFRSVCTRRSSCCLPWFPFFKSDICHRLLYSVKICLDRLRDRFLLIVPGVKFFAHWSRIVAAFVSFCAQYCCCMPVKSVTTHLRGDLLPAACDFRSVIAYFILWKSVCSDWLLLVLLTKRLSCWSWRRILWGRRMRPSRPASIGICTNTSWLVAGHDTA